MILFHIFKSNTSNEMKPPSLKDIYHKKQRENKQLPERNLTSASNPNHPPEVKLSALLGENKRCFMTLTRILSFFSLGDLKPTHLNKQTHLRGERESLLFSVLFLGTDSGPNVTHEAKSADFRDSTT